MLIDNFILKIARLSLIFWLTSAACTLIPKPNGTIDNNLSSRPLVRDPDPYERLDDSRIIPISELPIVIINVRGKDIFFDRRTKKLLKPPGYFDNISKFREGLAGASKNGKTGFINDRGEWVISPRFEGAMNLLGSSNNQEYSRMYDLDVFNEGTTVIVVGEKYKFINKQGQVFTSGFDFVRGFDRGVAVVSVGKKYGLIDRQGEFIISPQSEQELYPYVDRRGILVELNGREQCFDKRGSLLHESICQVIKVQKQQEENAEYPPDKSPFVVKNGAVYHNGKLLADRQWDEVVGSYQRTNSRNVFLYRVGKKWGVVHGSGEIKTPPQFDFKYSPIEYSFYSLFPNGLARVSIDGKFGFVDEMGKLAIPLKFKDVGTFDFDPDLTPAEVDGKWGYIDRQGNFVIPPQFADRPSDFNRRFSSLAMVKLKNKYGFIDRQGKLVVPAQYDEINDNTPFSSVGMGNYYDSLRKEELTQARIGTKWGYINTQGTIQIPIAFDEAGAFKYGVAEVKIGSRTFYIDRSGKTLPF